MKFLTVLCCGLLSLTLPTVAQQLKLGDNPSVVKKDAVLELNSTNQGFLLPRVLKSQILAGGKLFSADDGMLVFVNDGAEKILYNKRNGVWEKVGDYTESIWNANKIQSRNVAATAPVGGDVLKWNAVNNAWQPAPDDGAGVSYATLADNDIGAADAPDTYSRMKIWASPVTGVVTNGPLGTGAHSWNVLSFKGNGFTTQLYFDKNTLAIKEWGGNVAPLSTNAGNIWYKLVSTNGDSSFTDGGLVFGGKSSDASTEVKQNAEKLFWDIANKRLGVGTNLPTSTLHAGGSFAANVQSLPLANITLNETHNVVVFRKSTSGTTNFTVTLPLSSTCSGREYTIVRDYTAGSGTITVAVQGGDVLRAGTTLAANAALKIQSIGYRWIILVNNTSAL